MAADNKFTEAMALLSYDQLHDIVVKFRDEYELEAVIAAEAEVEKRNLAGEKLVPKENVTKTKKQTKAEKFNAPLQIHWKILTLLFPGLINLMIADELKAKGYDRQYREIWRWFFYGFAFYVALLILIMILAAIFT